MNADTRWTIDTNILIYAVDLDSGPKQEIAQDIIGAVARNDGILTLQALGEFYHATTRKNLLPKKTAQQYIDDWRAVFTIVTANEIVQQRAMTATQANNLSFWDAMICATAASAGCGGILSEDMQHGWSFDAVTIVNPFANDAARWTEPLIGAPH